MSNLDAILRRAKALHETAQRGGSENEMSMAAEALAMLLARENLLLADLATATEAVCIVKNVTGKYNETWRKTVYDAGASLFFCDYFFKAVGTRDVGMIHCIIGEPHNVEVAAEMGAFFEGTINRLANEASRTHSAATAEHTSRHRFIRSFRLAASERLRLRVNQHVRRAKLGELVDDHGSTLPVLQTLYDRQQLLYEAFLRLNNVTITSTKARDQRLSELGTLLGRAAGDNISFTTQIPRSGTSPKLALPGA